MEFRALLEAYRRGRIDNARLREMTGLDTLAASALLRRLRDRELLTLHAAGASSFYELDPAIRVESLAKSEPSGPTAQAPTSDWGGSARIGGGSSRKWSGSSPDQITSTSSDPVLPPTW